MDFENVNVASLKSAISGCLSKIEYQKEQHILNDISPNNVWDCSAKDNLITAIKNMIGIDYPKIENGLEKLQQAAVKIEEYKKIVGQIKSIDEQIRNLNSNRYITYTDYRGRTRRRLNASVVNRINELKRQRINLNNKKVNLKNEINRLLSEI